MKNIRLFLFLIITVIGITILGILCFMWFDSKAYCLDVGKIFDPIQKICRDDCLTWDEKYGCIPITEENIEKEFIIEKSYKSR